MLLVWRRAKQGHFWPVHGKYRCPWSDPVLLEGGHRPFLVAVLLRLLRLLVLAPDACCSLSLILRTTSFYSHNVGKPTVSLYCRDLYKGRCNYGVGVAGKIVAPNRKPRSENQMGLAVRSLRRPCSTPAEHACVWRRSDCATSGPQEQSSEHGWSLARRRVRVCGSGWICTGAGLSPRC